MSFVLDASITLAWVYPDEINLLIVQIFNQTRQNGAWVPTHWRLEIANALEMDSRRGRHDAVFRDKSLADLAQMPITVDPDTNDHAWGATAKLAETHRLTIYDAAYLELALRRSLPLASLDKDLRAAAKKEKVILLGK